MRFRESKMSDREIKTRNETFERLSEKENETEMWQYIEKQLENLVVFARSEEMEKLRTVMFLTDFAERQEALASNKRVTRKSQAREKVLQLLEASIQRHIETELHEGLGVTRSDLLTRAANTLVSDLQALGRCRKQVFPMHFDVVGLFRKHLEKTMIWRCIHQAPFVAQWSPKSQLLLISWIDTYVDIVKKMTPESILDSEERLHRLEQFSNELMLEYAQTTLTRIQHQLQIILQQKSKVFCCERGSMHTSIPEDVFRLFSNEISIVSSHGIRGKRLSLFVRNAIFQVLGELQHIKLKDIFANEKEEISPEHCCAFLNDMESMHDHFDNQLLLQIRDSIQCRRQCKELQERFDSLAAGFTRAIDRGSRHLVDFIFQDLERHRVLQMLFTKKWEYGTCSFANIFKSTCLDYFSYREDGLRTWLASDVLFGRAIGCTISQVTKMYIERFLMQRRPLKRKSLVVRMLRQDAQVLEHCFNKFIQVLHHGGIPNRSSLHQAFDVIRLLADCLQDRSPERHFSKLADEFGTMAPVAMRRILDLRLDLELSQRKVLKQVIIPRFEVDQLQSPPLRFDLRKLPRVQKRRFRTWRDLPSIPSSWLQRKHSSSHTAQKSLHSTRIPCQNRVPSAAC